MSEHEKQQQIGKLAEEVSHVKGQLNQLNEKLHRASTCFPALDAIYTDQLDDQGWRNICSARRSIRQHTAGLSSATKPSRTQRNIANQRQIDPRT
jgi:hypothetical protein